LQLKIIMMQVLIVDSSSEIVERLEEILTEANITTAIYNSFSYENAIRLFYEHEPDVVILCANLRKNESMKLLSEIKSVIYKTVVIILSINMDEYINEQCRLMGADYFLDKYRDFEKIPGIINVITVTNDIVNKTIN